VIYVKLLVILGGVCALALAGVVLHYCFLKRKLEDWRLGRRPKVKG